MSRFGNDDPSTIEGLTPRIERGARPSHYRFRYHASVLVECAFCDNHTPHFRGYVVEMEDGRIALCGNKCAKDFFGEEVAASFDADLRRRERRLEAETFLAPVLAGIEPAVAAIEPWIDLERLVDSAISAVVCSGIHPDFRRVVTSAGVIERIHQEVIEAKEIGRDGMPKTRRYIRETVVGRIRGARILVGRDGRLERAIGKLQEIRAKGESDATKLTDSMLDHLKGKRGDAFSFIREGVERIQAAKVFFTPENVEQLGLWCRDRQTDYEVRWIRPITGPAIAIRARRLGGPLNIQVPIIDAVPAVDDLLGPLQRSMPLAATG